MLHELWGMTALIITGRITSISLRDRIIVAVLAIVVVFVIVGVLPKGDNICNSPAADVSAIDFSPDGKYLATGSLDTGVRVLDVTATLDKPDGATDQTNPKACQQHTDDLQYTSYTDGVVAVKFSPDGQYLATASLNSAGLWKMNGDGSISRITFLKHNKGSYDSYNRSVVAIDFNFNNGNKYLVTADSGGMILVWDINKVEHDINNLKPVAHLDYAAYVMAVSFSPDGKYIVTSVNKKALVWDWQTHSEDQKADPLPVENVTDVTFSQEEGEYVVAAATMDGSIKVFNITNPKNPTTLTLNTYITKVSFSPDGKYIAAISLAKKAHVWDWKANSNWKEPFSSLENSSKNMNIIAIVFLENQYFAIADANNVTQWDTTIASTDKMLLAGENFVSLAFGKKDKNEKYLAAASANGKIRIIKLQNET